MEKNYLLTGCVRFYLIICAIPVGLFLLLGGVVALIEKILSSVWNFSVRLLYEAGDDVFPCGSGAASQSQAESEQGNENKPDNQLKKVIIFLLVILVALWWWRGCQNQHDYQPRVVEVETPAEVYEQAFDDVVIARAYLDGVQTEVDTKCPRALIGFKFINDKPVKDYDFEGKTYEEAVRIVAEDWKPLVMGNLNENVQLSEQQMVVVTLAAMRMGSSGFKRSTFLQKLNEGAGEDAGLWLLLQTPDGEIRQTGEEPLQYFYVLRLLWEHKIEIRDLLDMPMFSYKSIKIKALYTDIQPEFGEEEEILLFEGDYPTPREALGLD